MQCRFFVLVSFIFVLIPTFGFSHQTDSDLFVSDIQIINLSKALIDQGSFAVAKSLLLKKSFAASELEKERLFLIGRIFMLEKNYEDAIEIFEFILSIDPTIARIRFELALAYMAVNSWYSAEKNLRLSASEKNLSISVKQNINHLLYLIRKNKNWSVGFNFGFSPDNNINNTHGGEECVITSFGILCRKLPAAVKEIGFNTSIFGSYDFKFTDNLHLKNIVAINNIKYKNKKYDSTNISFLSGPRFIYDSGEIYLGPTINRRWLGHRPYNYGSGLQLEINHDILQRLSVNFNTSYISNFYDEYKFLNGVNNSFGFGFSYAINSFMNLNIKTERGFENTKEKEYKNRHKNFTFGINADVYYGFVIYFESSIEIQKYYNPRIFVKNYQFVDMAEQNNTQKFLISISNKKLYFYDFMPVFRYWYTKRTSNVEQNEYKKNLFDITITRKF